jgi:signal transduction histidine kinase
VTETARSISETDLRRRIPVETDDEVGELAMTFNQMLDRLEAGIDAQRQFVSDAGHELRTPITVIRGHLEILGDDPAERAETVDLVTDELDRMARMVNDLLLLAKAERPGFLEPETIRVGDLLHEVSVKASALAPRDWRVEGYAANLSVVADRQRLTQALMNLATNAVEHTDEGATVAFGAEARPGGLDVWVRDTGVGIPVEEQQRIFERFARGPRERRNPHGTGLGLAIVRAIAEAHGGRVTVTSRPGEGATFTISLPPNATEVIDLR